MGFMALPFKHSFLFTNQYWILANQTDITNLKLLITIGIFITLLLAAVIVIFVVYYQRKALLKDSEIKLFEQEQQILFFRATIEGEEKQKEKIAHNLHDSINPMLSVLKLNLSKHRNEIIKNKFNIEDLKNDAEIIDNVIDGIRTTCYNLIPKFLLEYGLIKSLNQYIDNINTPNNINGKFNNNLNTTEAPLSQQDQLSVYRICLEIINNLIKHSLCSIFELTISQPKGNLVLEFIHNGKGIDNEEVKTLIESNKGLGLKSLKTRAFILNANLNFSNNNNTAVITLTIPTLK
jgi:two-component system NarL family sensor kinase